MPSKQEYDAAFKYAMGPVLEFPVANRAGASKICAEARRRIVREQTNLRKGISDLWRQRFAEIKRENDDFEKALKESYQDAHEYISAKYGDLLEGLQR